MGEWLCSREMSDHCMNGWNDGWDSVLTRVEMSDHCINGWNGGWESGFAVERCQTIVWLVATVDG